MYIFLFNLTGVAMIGWALLILLPQWSVTRWVADHALFPIFLAAIYVAALVPLLASTGFGIISDFGSAEGVIRLLAEPDIALIAWIHILAFDHFMGVLIYRDNTRHRVVPVALQSVLLFVTLMFGPVGFLTYFTIRVARRGRVFEADALA